MKIHELNFKTLHEIFNKIAKESSHRFLNSGFIYKFNIQGLFIIFALSEQTSEKIFPTDLNFQTAQNIPLSIPRTLLDIQPVFQPEIHILSGRASNLDIITPKSSIFQMILSETSCCIGYILEH
jgi:hypothetical protein